MLMFSQTCEFLSVRDFFVEIHRKELCKAVTHLNAERLCLAKVYELWVRKISYHACLMLLTNTAMLLYLYIHISEFECKYFQALNVVPVFEKQTDQRFCMLACCHWTGSITP